MRQRKMASFSEADLATLVERLRKMGYNIRTPEEVPAGEKRGLVLDEKYFRRLENFWRGSRTNGMSGSSI